MSLSLRIIYITVIFLVIATDAMYEQMGIHLEKIVISLAVVCSVIFFNRFSSFMKKWFYVLCIYFSFCLLESYYFYLHPLKYMHVFSKIMCLYLVFMVYGFYKRYDKLYVSDIVIIILFSLIINVVLVNRSALSISAFLKNDRGVTAESIYMLVIPLLYFYNKYFQNRNVFYIFAFLITLGFIIFFQHRTVWVSSAIGLVINFFLIKKTNIKIDTISLVPVVIIILLSVMSLGVMIISNDKIVERIQTSIDQIMNPTGDSKDDQASTSEWRYMQFQAYWPFIEDNIFFGMRLKGFELPIQFYDHTGNLVWEDNTGHHFHSFYVDRLFYQGIFGLLLIVLPALIYIYSNTNLQKKLTLEQLVLIVFVATGLFFGMSYILPVYFYGILGYALFQCEPKEYSV